MEKSLRELVAAEILGEFGGEHHADRKAAALADSILSLIDDRIEEWRDGIDHAAEHGSEAATRDGVVISELQEALFGT